MIEHLPSANFRQTLTQAISEMLARNKSYFGVGGPGYYGVEVTSLSSDDSEFDLTLMFKAGVRYCCVEHGCHMPLYDSSEQWFKEVRNRLRMAGIENVPPMTVRKLHVIVEKGVISDGLPGELYQHESGLEYDRGPFHEVGQTDDDMK